MSTESSYERCKEQRPQIIEVSGTRPGVLDDTQPSRLLRTSNSILSFASFDPYIAAPHELGFQNLNLKSESCRPKRIIIETIPGFGSFWRWVPSARKMQDVQDEGIFPRVIDICGRYVNCSQDQWDMYKLDPKYDCFVKYPPALTVISIKDTKHPGISSESSSHFENDDGLEPMIVDDDPTPFNSYSPQRKSQKILDPISPHIFGFTKSLPNDAEELKPRKRVNVSFQGLHPSEDDENQCLEEDSSNRNTRYYTPKYQKRARTLSPESKRRALNANKFSRRNAKQGKWENEIKARRQQRESHFLREVLSEVPPAEANTQYNTFTDIPEEDETSDSHGPQRHGTENQLAEDDHERRLAESRRKMEQLNADRPRQRVRESCERGEDFIPIRGKSEGPDYIQRQKANLEEEKRKAEVNRREQEHIRLRKEEQARHLCNQLLEGFQRERTARHQPWNQGLWNSSRAIERYKAISLFFDKAKFSSSQSPLTHIDIPWPTLQHPSLSSPRDMDWETVTQFFNAVKVGLRGQAFNDLIKVSLQRFHPDRWKSRNLYSAIIQENERNEIETAVSTVSKALGSLWAELKASSEV